MFSVSEVQIEYRVMAADLWIMDCTGKHHLDRSQDFGSVLILICMFVAH